MNLTDELHAMTDHVPALVRSDPGQAWREATRRRRLRRTSAVLGVMVASVVVLVGVRSLHRQPLLAPVSPAEGPAARHVLTLPTRIERPYLLHDLPRRAGRLAGVVWSKQQWLAVSPTGHVWRLPLGTQRDYPPAISPDGSTIAFLQDFPADRHSRLLVWRTTTGVLHFYSQVGNGLLHGDKPVDPLTRFWIEDEAPTYFSPDGTRLVVAGERLKPVDRERALLLDWSNNARVTVLDSPAGTSTAFPAGWADDSHLVWVDARPQRPTAVIAALDGTVVRLVRLTMSRAQAGRVGQWVGPVSPDGRHLAVGSGNDPTARDQVVTFPLDRDPSPYVVAAGPVADPAMLCPLSWGTSTAPAIPHTSPRLLAGSGGVVADPRLHVECAIWASDALAGAHHDGIAGTLFGNRTAWWTWWWRELALGLAAVAVGGFVVIRRRLRGTSPADDLGS